MNVQAVAFSGHRPQKFPWKYDESSPECVALKATLAERIAEFANVGNEWPTPAQEEYWSILKETDSTCYVSREYHKDCMLDRNRFMVDHTTVLFAVYNGEKRGGTAATVRYAREKEREIFMLTPVTLIFTHEVPESDNPSSEGNDV